MKILCAFLIAFLTLHLCAQTRAGAAAQLVGTWKLVSTTLRFPDGTERPDPQVGATPSGYMIYTDTHRMCAIFLNPERPKWVAPAKPTDDEAKSAVAMLGAYCGTYEVNEKEGYVIHHVELERIPNLVGSTRKRFFQLAGNRLTLRIDPAQLQPGLAGTTIIWERVIAPEPQDAVSRKLIGAWRLVSTMQKLADGSTRPNPAYGPNLQGSMIYAGTNRMCAIFLNPDRPKWRATDAPTPAEAKSALDGLGAYCATWEVNADQAFVLHHVELDRIPNAIGTTRKRFFSFEGERLVLHVDPAEMGGGVVDTTIIWEPVK